MDLSRRRWGGRRPLTLKRVWPWNFGYGGSGSLIARVGRIKPTSHSNRPVTAVFTYSAPLYLLPSLPCLEGPDAVLARVLESFEAASRAGLGALRPGFCCFEGSGIERELSISSAQSALFFIDYRIQRHVTFTISMSRSGITTQRSNYWPVWIYPSSLLVPLQKCWRTCSRQLGFAVGITQL